MRSVCTGRNLVIQDIAGTDGVLLTSYLDAIAPYLPGGSQACFAHVYVGTVDLPWTGPGSKYVEGVQNAEFRSRYVSLSRTTATAFVARYPNVTVDWYLSYEANLNDLFYAEIEGAYADMFLGEMKALTALRPTAAFAWSPTFWFPYSAYKTNTAGMTQLSANVRKLFSTLSKGAKGVSMLDLQDYVAGSSCQPTWNRVTPSDAVGWAKFVKSLGVVADVRINVEQFSLDCASGGVRAGNPAEVVARESFYGAQGLTLGPAFEVRYWLRTHGLLL